MAGCCPFLFHMIKEDRDPHGFSVCMEDICELWNDELKKCSLSIIAACMERNDKEAPDEN